MPDFAARQMLGQGLRPDLLLLVDDDCSTSGAGVAAAGAGSSVSSSSSISSSCSIVRSILSDERPNCVRLSRAICNLSFSISSALATRPRKVKKLHLRRLPRLRCVLMTITQESALCVPRTPSLLIT